MDGEGGYAIAGGTSSFDHVKLAALLFVSMILHALILLVPVAPYASVTEHRAVTRSALDVSFRGFSLIRRERLVVSDSVAVKGGAASPELSRPRSSHRLPAVLPAKDPELISDMELVFDGLQARGFMILRLRVLESGSVGEAEIIYSGLPADLSETLREQFAMAQFKPAEREGQVVDAELLLRVDVD